MSTLYMKQKVFSVGEKFTVTDEQGDVRYKVKGSVLKIPKEFRLQSVDGKLVAKMKKKSQTNSIRTIFRRLILHR